MKVLHLDTNHSLLIEQFAELGFENHEDYTSTKEEVEKKETADERASIMNKIQEIQYQKKLQQNQQQQLTNNKNEED